MVLGEKEGCGERENCSQDLIYEKKIILSKWVLDVPIRNEIRLGVDSAVSSSLKKSISSLNVYTCSF